MLWIEPLNMIYCAGFGGLVGGAIVAVTQAQNHRFNIRMMEDHWNADIKYLRCRLEVLDQKLSTILVDKPVSKSLGGGVGNGCDVPRHFKHGDQK